MGSQDSSIKRPLFAWEIQEARRVFAGNMDYEIIRIHENAAWLNTLNRLGSGLNRIPYDPVPKAITMGNHCLFPGQLYQPFPRRGIREISRIGWLIHELTHVWQYQHMGWRYLILSLRSQFKLKSKAYNFGGEEGLLERLSMGWKLIDFNLEQQGDLARTYYQALREGKAVSAWKPFIEEFQLPFTR